MLGHQLDDQMLQDIINEVDDDGSGELEFEEFVQLAARFMVEEDAEVSFRMMMTFISSKNYSQRNFFSQGDATRAERSFQIVRQRRFVSLARFQITLACRRSLMLSRHIIA